MTQTKVPICHRLPRLLVAGALAAMLAGCYQPRTAQREYPDDYRQRHPITLKEGQRTVEVFLGHGGLAPAQRADVMAFAVGWKREGTGGIVIDMPKGGPTDRAAMESMREIGSILAAAGVQRNAVYVRTYAPSSTSLASIKIAYAKLVADAGPCGLWPADLGPAFDPSYNDNRPYWNLGCATQRNLASMVDNPADLVQPRGETPAYAGRRSTVADKFRKGDNPSGTYGSAYDTGKISDLGK